METLKTALVVEVMLIINLLAAWGIGEILDNIFPRMG